MGIGELADPEFGGGMPNPAGERVGELPDDAHGVAALVADVFGEASEEIALPAVVEVCLLLPEEQEDAFAALGMVDVALARGTGRGDPVLGLPVEELVGDGVILVERGRGEVPRVFVEFHKERLDSVVGVVGNPFAGGTETLEGIELEG